MRQLFRVFEKVENKKVIDTQCKRTIWKSDQFLLRISDTQGEPLYVNSTPKNKIFGIAVNLAVKEEYEKK